MSGPLVGAFALASAAIFLGIALVVRDLHTPAIALAHPDAEALEDAGWRFGIPRWEAIRALVTGAAVLALLALHAPIGLALGATVAPSVWIRVRADGARARSRRAFLRILVATEAALRSGISLPEALRRGTDAAGDRLASRPLVNALRAFDLGSGLDAALSAALGGYASDQRAHEAVATLQVGIVERLPRERMAELLAAIVDRCTFEERLEDEVDARAAGARHQQWILAALVPGLAAYLAVTIPSLATTLASDVGRFVLIPAAGALEVAGIVLSRHIVRAAVR
jgi:Flp pilus assembly protein TadB